MAQQLDRRHEASNNETSNNEALEAAVVIIVGYQKSPIKCSRLNLVLRMRRKEGKL